MLSDVDEEYPFPTAASRGQLPLGLIVEGDEPEEDDDIIEPTVRSWTPGKFRPTRWDIVCEVKVGSTYRWEIGKGQVEIDNVGYSHWDGMRWYAPSPTKQTARSAGTSAKQDYEWRYCDD